MECYNLKHLRKFENKPFIYVRKCENNEQIHNYSIIIKEVIQFIEQFQKYEIENYVGIAVNLKEHTVTSCILLLGILNHKCHFYCLDVEDTKDVENYLRLSGVKYMISKGILKSDLISYKSLNAIRVFNENFYMGKVETYTESFHNLRLCYTIATSGSTGLPKMVHVPYESIEPNIKSLSCLLKLQENDLIFLGSPPTFDPFVVEFFLALENGASILITSKEMRLHPQHLLKILFPCNATFKGITILQTTPSLLRLFGNQNIHHVILNTKSSLRCLILGGEEFPPLPELKTWLPPDFPALSDKRIFNIYGITEVSCWSTIYEYQFQKHFEYNRVPLGKPLDEFTSLRIIDKDENNVSNICCKGELLIGSTKRHCFIPQCDHDINVLKSNDIIYRKTGDIVQRDIFENIYFIGRSNNSIKRLGKRLCLDSLDIKIENVLNIKKLNFKVICLWHKETTKLILYINSNKITTREKSTILHILKQNLEQHEHPDEIYYSNEFPLNRHGKIDRTKLMEKILTIKRNQMKSPLDIFKDFLENVMGIKNEFEDEHDIDQPNSRKRLKSVVNISFTQAGGTSFQALSLAAEIADMIANPAEQRKILELLLDNNISINNILVFLSSTTNKLETNTKELSIRSLKQSWYIFKLLWRCDFKKCIDASPKIFEDNVIAVGSHSCLLLTLNTATGTEISRLELPDRLECSVVFVSSELALVGCYDGFLYGFNFLNGSILWKINVMGMIKAKPLVIDNMVIVGSYAEEFNVMAFDMKSSQCLWKLKLGTKGIFSSPLKISDETALLCSLDGSYTLIESTTGSMKWLEKLESPIFSTPAKIQNEIFVLAEVNGQILLCKAENGEKIASYQADGNIFSGLTLHQHGPNKTFIIFGCHDKHVYCLNFDASNKHLTLSWKFPLNSAVYSTPVIFSKRYLLTCSTKGLMVLLDLETSNHIGSYDLKADVFSTPCIREKIIYVGARDNFLYAFQLE